MGENNTHMIKNTYSFLNINHNIKYHHIIA